MQVYQGLHWPEPLQATAAASSVLSPGRADECSVCLCSSQRTAAEIQASKALHGCPNLLPLLGTVNFAAKSAGRGSMGRQTDRTCTEPDDLSCRPQPAVPHLQGYCTARPHCNLDAYVHGGRGYEGDPSARMYCSLQHSVVQLTGIARQLLQCTVAVQERGLVHTGTLDVAAAVPHELLWFYLVSTLKSCPGQCCEPGKEACWDQLSSWPGCHFRVIVDVVALLAFCFLWGFLPSSTYQVLETCRRIHTACARCRCQGHEHDAQEPLKHSVCVQVST